MFCNCDDGTASLVNYGKGYSDELTEVLFEHWSAMDPNLPLTRIKILRFIGFWMGIAYSFMEILFCLIIFCFLYKHNRNIRAIITDSEWKRKSSHNVTILSNHVSIFAIRTTMLFIYLELFNLFCIPQKKIVVLFNIIDPGFFKVMQILFVKEYRKEFSSKLKKISG